MNLQASFPAVDFVAFHLEFEIISVHSDLSLFKFFLPRLMMWTMASVPSVSYRGTTAME